MGLARLREATPSAYRALSGNISWPCMRTVRI
jgi:hypothetical protein